MGKRHHCSDLRSLIHFIVSLQLLLHHSSAQSQPDPYLLFANLGVVQRRSLNNPSVLDLVYENDENDINYRGMDLDMRTGDMYLSDTRQKQIVRGNVDGRQTETLHRFDTDMVNAEPIVSIAYDWISHKVYWANSLTRTIEVLDPVTKQRKVLLDFRNGRTPNNIIPRFIVLDPLRGLMYWSEWNVTKPGEPRPGEPLSASVFRTSMDGSDNAVILQNDSVGVPNGLSLDLDSQTLYLVDTHRDVVAKSSTSGTDFSVTDILSAASIERATLINLEYYNGTLYFNERFMHKLYSLRVNPTMDNTEVVLDLNREIGNIRVVDAERNQPRPAGSNPCAADNGGCSHLCLLSATEPLHYSCACPEGVNPRECSGPPTDMVPSTASVTDGGIGPSISCSENPCRNGGTCDDSSQGAICSCLPGFTGDDCSVDVGTGCTESVRSSEFVVSGSVFLAVTLVLMAVILILAFIIAIFILKTKQHGSRRGSKRNSIAGMTDGSPRDSPTHVVVGRLSDHDYISIKSRESPAPRGIVINIENLGGRSTPNQYTIHKGINTSSISSNLAVSNGVGHISNGTNADTLPASHRHHGNETVVMGDSDNDSEYNSLEPRVDQV